MSSRALFANSAHLLFAQVLEGLKPPHTLGRKAGGQLLRSHQSVGRGLGLVGEALLFANGLCTLRLQGLDLVVNFFQLSLL